jgi:hypothetical protein
LPPCPPPPAWPPKGEIQSKKPTAAELMSLVTELARKKKDKQVRKEETNVAKNLESISDMASVVEKATEEVCRASVKKVPSTSCRGPPPTKRQLMQHKLNQLNKSPKVYADDDLNSDSDSSSDDEEMKVTVISISTKTRVKSEPGSTDPSIITISDDDDAALSSTVQSAKSALSPLESVLSASVSGILSNLPSNSNVVQTDSDVKPEVKPNLLIQGFSAQHISDLKTPFVRFISKKSRKRLSSSFRSRKRNQNPARKVLFHPVGTVKFVGYKKKPSSPLNEELSSSCARVYVPRKAFRITRTIKKSPKKYIPITGDPYLLDSVASTSAIVDPPVLGTNVRRSCPKMAVNTKDQVLDTSKPSAILVLGGKLPSPSKVSVVFNDVNEEEPVSVQIPDPILFSNFSDLSSQLIKMEPFDLDSEPMEIIEIDSESDLDDKPLADSLDSSCDDQVSTDVGPSMADSLFGSLSFHPFWLNDSSDPNDCASSNLYSQLAYGKDDSLDISDDWLMNRSVVNYKSTSDDDSRETDRSYTPPPRNCESSSPSASCYKSSSGSFTPPVSASSPKSRLVSTPPCQTSQELGSTLETTPPRASHALETDLELTSVNVSQVITTPTKLPSPRLETSPKLDVFSEATKSSTIVLNDSDQEITDVDHRPNLKPSKATKSPKSTPDQFYDPTSRSIIFQSTSRTVRKLDLTSSESTSTEPRAPVNTSVSGDNQVHQKRVRFQDLLHFSPPSHPTRSRSNHEIKTPEFVEESGVDRLNLKLGGEFYDLYKWVSRKKAQFSPCERSKVISIMGPLANQIESKFPPWWNFLFPWIDTDRKNWTITIEGKDYVSTSKAFRMSRMNFINQDTLLDLCFICGCVLNHKYLVVMKCILWKDDYTPSDMIDWQTSSDRACYLHWRAKNAVHIKNRNPFTLDNQLSQRSSSGTSGYFGSSTPPPLGPAVLPQEYI